VVVCKIAQTPPEVPSTLLGSVPRDGVGVGRTIRFPVAGVVNPPLPGTVAADLPILGILSQFLIAALVAALSLARLSGARRLIRVKSRWRELLMAIRATPLLHLFRVTALE
jgi:hypothetical protein